VANQALILATTYIPFMALNISISVLDPSIELIQE
jgi:hypothetical protein